MVLRLVKRQEVIEPPQKVVKPAIPKSSDPTYEQFDRLPEHGQYETVIESLRERPATFKEVAERTGLSEAQAQRALIRLKIAKRIISRVVGPKGKMLYGLPVKERRIQ